MHDYITIFLAFLDIKELDINMTISLSGNTVVHNINSSIVVIINWIRRVMGNPSYQIMDINNLAVLASVTAVIISSSVELNVFIY